MLLLALWHNYRIKTLPEESLFRRGIGRDRIVLQYDVLRKRRGDEGSLGGNRNRGEETGRCRRDDCRRKRGFVSQEELANSISTKTTYK